MARFIPSHFLYIRKGVIYITANLEDSLYMFNAHVDRVIDGDTIVVTIDLGFDVFAKRKVRLLNVDTPERGQINYQEATDFTKSKIYNKNIILQTYKDDTFGCYLGVIWYKENEDDEIYELLSNKIIENKLEKPNSEWNNYIELRDGYYA